MKKRPVPLTKRTVRWLGILAVLLCYLAGVFERAELMAVDFRYRLFSDPPHPAVLLVVVDRQSLKEFPVWPWPRRYYAEAIRKIHGGGARIIGMDFDFSAYSEEAEDGALARAISEAGNVVLGTFYEDKISQEGLKVRSANLPVAEFAEAARGMGSILFPIDSDGAMRRAYRVDDLHGVRTLSFAGKIASLAGPPEVVEDGGWMAGAGMFYIRYVGGPGSFPAVSFADVLEGRLPDDVFRDRIVLVGATALELRDIWETPFGLMPGIEIQANTLQTFLSGSGIERLPPWVTAVLVLLGALGLDLSLGGAFRRRNLRPLADFLLFSASALAAALAFCALSVYLFRFELLILDTVPVLAALLVHFLLSSFAFNLFTGRSVQQQAASLSTLQSVGGLSLRKRPLDRSLDFVFSMLKEILDAQFVAVELHHPKTGRFIRRIASNGEPDREGDAALSAPCRQRVEEALSTRRPVVVRDLRAVLAGSEPGPPVRSSLFVPLMTYSGQYGVLHAHSCAPQDFEEDSKLIYTIANQIAVNVENMGLLKEVKRLFYGSIQAFSSALELRDNETEGHSQRVAGYAVEISDILGLGPEERENLRQGALLHDIGKIGVADAILRKPGRLTDEEMQAMKMHAEYGYWMLKSVDFPEPVSLMLLQHHEAFDGSGYPAGLKGEGILLNSRIFVVADTYDAIRSDRPYRRGRSHEAAVQEILRCSGSQFDPAVVAAFLRVPGERLERIRLEVTEAAQRKSLQTVFGRDGKTPLSGRA